MMMTSSMMTSFMMTSYMMRVGGVGGEGREEEEWVERESERSGVSDCEYGGVSHYGMV